MKKLFVTAAVLLSLNAYILQAAYTWSSVQIWGGGYVPGVAFHPTEEGLAYIRTDVGGAYRLNLDKNTWAPLNDMFTQEHDMGSIAIGLDMDNPNRVYVTGGLYLGEQSNEGPGIGWCGSGAAFFRSDNKGATWTRVTLQTSNVQGTDPSMVIRGGDDAGKLCLGGNFHYRGTGNRIAVKGNTIFLGTDQNGLLKSTNRGDTWVTVAPSTFSNTSGVSAVQFDKDGNIYAAPFSGGVFKSTDDGTTWSNMSASFTGVVYQMSYSPLDNGLWFTTNGGSNPLDHQAGMSGGRVFKVALESGTFTQVTMPNHSGGYLGISVNPKDASQIVVATGGTWGGNGGPIDGSAFIPNVSVYMSTNGGAAWKDILAAATWDAATAYNAASSNPHWLSALAVNPFDKDHVIFGTGYGVWSTFNATADTPLWIFTNKGIEETVPLGLASTKFGAPLVSVLGDIDGFYHDDLNTPPLTRHKMGDGTSEAGTNYDIDFAGQKPNYMVRIHKASSGNYGAWSEDGGKTWKNFGSRPSAANFNVDNGENNFVAVSADGSAIVWNTVSHGVYYSTNNGTTWIASSTSSNLLRGFRPVADRVTAGTFYLYNAGSGTLYRSTDNGANWTAANTTLNQAPDWGYWAFRLFASPDNAGELWITQGANGQHDVWFGSGDNFRGIRRSTNGGTTFTEIPGMYFARSIGFGRGRNVADPSAVYAVGINNSGVNGVFRSDNTGGTWTRINTDNTMYGGINAVIGDPCVYSRVYLSTAGRGIITGIDNALAAPCDCEDRIDFENKNAASYRGPATSIKKPGLVRQGKILRSTAPIHLYSLSGRLVASSSTKGASKDAQVTLNMSRVPNGVYIAKSGTQSLKVKLHR
jgi:hypothetical protein